MQTEVRGWRESRRNSKGVGMPHRDKRIHEIAYLLWEQEGRPHGQDDRHWREAVAQYEAEQAAEARIEGLSGEPAKDEPSTQSEKKPAEAKAEEPAEKTKAAEEPAEKPKAAKAEEPAEKPKAAKAEEPAEKRADAGRAAAPLR